MVLKDYWTEINKVLFEGFNSDFKIKNSSFDSLYIEISFCSTDLLIVNFLTEIKVMDCLVFIVDYKNIDWNDAQEEYEFWINDEEF